MSSKSGPERRAAPRAWSLAARLTVWYTASAFALVLGATGFLYWVLATNLDREDDESLADEVRVLGALQDKPDEGAALRQEVERASATRPSAPLYVRAL